jgi:hypothetical protein
MLRNVWKITYLQMHMTFYGIPRHSREYSKSNFANDFSQVNESVENMHLNQYGVHRLN